MQSDTMIEDQMCTCLAASSQGREQHTRNHKVEELGRLARIPTILLSTTSHIPAVQVDDKNNIVNQRMCNGDLDARHHRALLLTGLILLPRAAVLRDHADQLLVSGHDGWHGRDQACAEHEVGDSRNVEERGWRGEAADQEFGPDVGRGEEVDEVETPGHHVEGDGEVDDCWMEWVAVGQSVSCILFSQGSQRRTYSV
jgi:hypothetical protein